jgi:hypothetical protein
MDRQNKLKEAAYISFGMFVLMLFGAIYFYRERMLFADASHIAFLTINEQKLQIQQYRFGSFITQMVPILCSKLGLSIKAILIAYSASFNLFYLFVAFLLTFWFKAYRFMVLYAFYWTLVTTHAFFWPNNEVHQGMAYMFLFFPALLAAGQKKQKILIALALLLVLGTTALFCHPLVLPPFIFLWVYLIIEKTHWPYNKTQTLILSIVAALIIAAKVYVSNKYAGYDSNLLSGVTHMKPSALKSVFSSPFANEIYRHVKVNYWLLPAVSVIGILTLLLKRQFFLAIWTLGCTLVFFILMCLTFGGYMEFISESEIMPGIIIATAPFVFLSLTYVSKEAIIITVLYMFFSRYDKFEGTRGHFSERVSSLNYILAKMKEKNLTKLVLLRKDGGDEWRWMIEWGSATESILLSASTGDKPVRQFVLLTPGDLETRVPKNSTDVMTCYEQWPVKKLKWKYFPVDTTRPYTIISYNEFMK